MAAIYTVILTSILHENAWTPHFVTNTHDGKWWLISFSWIFSGLLVWFSCIELVNFMENLVIKCVAHTSRCATGPVQSEDEAAAHKMQQARENAQQSFQLQVLEDFWHS